MRITILKATYTFAPTVGYFLTDKTAVGVSVETGKDATMGNHFCAGVFARHYFLNAGQNFKVYSQLGVNNNNDADNKAYVTANLDLGLNYFVTKNVVLSTSLANLISYNDQTSTFSAGFDGVKNPFTTATPKFGVIYKF